MAKLYIYGSSPNFSYSPLYNDMILPTDSYAHSDFAIVEPDPVELFEDLNDWSPCSSSIFSDIKKLQSSLDTMNGSSSTCSGSDSGFLDTFEIKTEIRNIDCMWSAPATSNNLMSSSNNNNNSSSSISDNSIIAGSPPTGPVVSPTAVLQSNINNNNKRSNSKQQQQQQKQQYEAQIKIEPIDNDYEQQLQQHSIPNSRTIKQEPQDSHQQQQQQQQQQTQSLQHIKPGMSLLRKSNVLQQQKNKQQQQQQNKFSSIKIPSKTATEFLRERDQLLPNTNANNSNSNSNYNTAAIASAAAIAATVTKNNTAAANLAAFGRPDTPLSLDDDPVAPEFKHNVDLRACVMGSNNISLVGSDPTTFINQLCEQLQDTTKNKIDLRNILPDAACDSGLLADVLDVIVKDDHRSLASLPFGNSGVSNNNNGSSCNSSRIGGGSTSTALHSHISAYEYDDDDDDDEEDEEDGDGEEEEEDDYGEEDDFDSSCGSASSASQLDYHRSISSASSNAASNMSAASSYASATSPASSIGGGGGGGVNNSQTSYPMMMHSDHSYTRCNDDLGTNLETPSDSDEEIDVVSIGDKKLPTNPSDKDRRALQTKVAHKFSNARIVKTPNGVRTIPPRRRITVELPYTPASSSPVKSVANSRYPSPSATPYQNQYTTKYVQQQTQHIINVMGDGTMTPTRHHQQHHPGGGGGGGSSTAGGESKQRKRILVNAANGGGGSVGNTIINNVEYMQQPASKKHRGSKKQKQMPVAAVAAAAAGNIVKRHYSLDEAADTIEKRNLHNDMERQRRIGLKNLFEALKKQIPSIKDKERAPKVNILREAAKLCEALTREDAQLSEQKMLLKEQLRKRQELLARLRAGMQRD